MLYRKVVFFMKNETDSSVVQQPCGLSVGFGREEVMPDTVLPLGGNGLVGREFTGINDILYITCVAFADEAGNTVLMYTMDTLKSEMFIHPLRTAVSEATGIPGERILFSATHTHSAPAVYADHLEGVGSYREIFRKAAIRAAQVALEDLTPSQLRIGTAQATGMAFSRHYIYEDGHLGSAGKKTHGAVVGHADPADEQVQLVTVIRQNKKDVLLMSVPVHGTSMSSEANKLISADVPGAIRAALEENTDYLVAYFIGAAGNQTPNSQAPDNHGLCVKDYGKKVAGYIADALPNVKPVRTGPIQLLWHTYIAESNKEKVSLYKEANEVTEAYSRGGMREAKPYLRKYGLSSVWEAYAIRRRKNSGDTLELPLSALRMGDLSFVFAPYEMFAPNGQYIKEHTPGEMTFVVTCANGAKGYLPMAHAYSYGVYETYVTLVRKGTAEDVARYYIQMIEKMKKQEEIA